MQNTELAVRAAEGRGGHSVTRGEEAAPGPVDGGAPGSAHAATLPVGCPGAGADLGPVPAPTTKTQRQNGDE